MNGCECGCGEVVGPDNRGRPRKYIHGHNRRGKGNPAVPRGWGGYQVVHGLKGSLELFEAQSQDAKDKLQDRLGYSSYWTEDRITKAIKRWVARYGRPPSRRQWARGEERPNFFRGEIRTSRPSSWTVLARFGTWNAAIRAAGYEPNRGGRPKRRGEKSA